MGFFDRLSNIFNKAQDWAKTTREINSKFKPFFRRVDNELSQIKEVNITIPAEVRELYLTLLHKDAEKYQKQINQYVLLSDRIEEHNKKVIAIQEGMKGFDYDLIIRNPSVYEYSHIYKHTKAVDYISTFKHYEQKYEDFSLRVLDIKNNFNNILLQYNLSIELENDFIFKSTHYIDANEKNIILKRRDNYIKSINILGNYKYYNFSKLDMVEKYIDNNNTNYVHENISSKIFDDINGKSLDNEQRKAILEDEVSSLVVAGAGSGKTLTICGKVKYLLEKNNVKPKDILLMSFSKKSVEDLKNKIVTINENIKVTTFHALGLDIINNYTNERHTVDEQIDEKIETYFRDVLPNRPTVFRNVFNYFYLFNYNIKNDKKYSNEGELFKELKKENFITLKDRLSKINGHIKEKYTIKHEYVKSVEELIIANYLFINGIDYIYEHSYENKLSTAEKRQYTPDFYLPKYGIYIEHYGIDKNGHAKQYDGETEQKYIEGIVWKRNLHQKYNTKYIETYSFNFSEGTIFDELENKLKQAGVKFKPLTDEQVKTAINSFYYGKSFKSFIKLVFSFVRLYKSRYRNDKEFELLKNSKLLTPFEKQRASLFLDICKDLYNYYKDRLIEEDKIDFDDMILESTNILKECEEYKYKYIIVDEFQDISYSRMMFLKELIKHGSSKLFAVGDDWQSIYRFTGCDINIFIDFRKHFGECVINKINYTHRNSQELQDIVGPFIKKNPKQINKIICSKKKEKNPIILIYYNNKEKALSQALSKINEINKNANVLLLGRNNFDINSFCSDSFFKDKNSSKRIISKDFPKMNIIFSTVHAAKGLEQDYVILINAEDSLLGFPNKIEDDNLLNLVLSEPDAYPYSEERRLWYVALTRTKNHVYILVDEKNPSKFVKEIQSKCLVFYENDHQSNRKIIYCPNCKSGELVKRDHDNREFYGCSNFPYCNYTNSDINSVESQKRCPKCGYFLRRKKGIYIEYFECSNESNCNYKINILPEYYNNDKT